MKRLSRVVTLLGASLLAAGMLLPVTAANAKVKFVMSNDNNGVGLKGKTFEVLKKEVEKRLADKVDVELHHSGTLFDQKTQIQGLQLGGANLIAPTQGIYSPLSKNINVLSLPFLLSSPESVQAAIDEPTIHKAIFSELEKKNILPLAVWINGPRDLSYKSSKPILVPADLHGIKIRVQPVPVDLQTWKVLGANVVGMSWSEVPTALQQGVIEAVEPTPNALVGAGLGEMIDYVTRLDYHYSFYIVSTNKQWWEKLPADVRSGIQDALNAATKWNWENGTKENEAAYDKVRKLGKKIETLTPEQRAKWAAAVKPVWEQYGVKQVGADVMKRLTEIADKHK